MLPNTFYIISFNPHSNYYPHFTDEEVGELSSVPKITQVTFLKLKAMLNYKASDRKCVCVYVVKYTWNSQLQF